MRLSSSKGEPSLTCLFFLIFFLCFFSGTLLDFLLVSEKLLLREDLPEVLLYCDSDIAEAPDMDIWSASKPMPPSLSKPCS